MTHVMPENTQSNEVFGFSELADLAYKEAGLVLSSSKATMIQSRLRHRMKKLSLNDLSAYCAHIEAELSGQERRHMISALTTNVTGFFREPHHFDILTQQCGPEMVTRLKKGKPVRIWSAGCSNGQEPYSIAMSMLAYNEVFATTDFKILATDIDPKVVNFASKGQYTKSQVSGIPDDLSKIYISKNSNCGGEDIFKIDKRVQNLVTFKELNLIGNWPMRGQFDVIFCRNVVIYFDSETQGQLWPRYHNALRSNGMIFVGHSERINDPIFESAGPTAYRKVDLQGGLSVKPMRKDA